MQPIRLPRIVIYVCVLAFLVLMFVVMKALKFYFVPVTFAALLAMLMLPINRILEKWKFPRILAILTSLLIILLIMALIIAVFSAQVVSFVKDLPEIQSQINLKFKDFQQFVERISGVPIERQMTFLEEEFQSILSSAGQWGTGILVATGGTLAGFGLMIIHFIFLLLYRQRIKAFMLGLIPKENHDRAKAVISEITKITRQYLTGVVTVMAILSVLNSVGLLVLGIENAIFFGVLASVLNIIPYIGVWVGSGLPVLMAIITRTVFSTL
jgi:predicted PurR-regulated permease PerM